MYVRLVMRGISALGFGVSLVACASATLEPVQLRFVPSALGGQSLVGRLTTIALDIYAEDTGVACTSSGDATGLAVAPEPTALVQAELGSENCPGGARFCGSLELEQSSAPRVFVARGLDETGAVFARACATVTLDRDAVDVDLVFQRALAIPTCGNNVLEAPETCEGDITDACDTECNSRELVVSTGASPNGTVNGEGARKTAPTLATTADAVVVLYTDRTSASQDGEVALRVMTPALGAPTSPPMLATSFFLPTATAPGTAAPGTQENPAACVAGNSLLVAFESAGAGADVSLRALSTASYASGAQLLLSGDADVGTAGDQRFPAIACSATGGLTVWRDVTSGRVLGRKITLPATLGRVQELGGASDGSKVSVVRRNGGWVAAWDAGRQIRYRVMGEDGTPSGGELTLEGDAVRGAPRLAALEDGRVALAFTEGEDAARGVRLQRFDVDGRLFGEPVVVSEGDGAESPFVVGATAAGGAYAVVWLTGNTVMARYLGGDAGTLLNPLTSTEDSFAASVVEGRTRTALTAAVLGSTLQIAWHDAAADGGIVMRLLPVPTR